ncbi:MAG: MerR family transcriptional regulator [Clostridia bacterium]|nr:MerR family transcriptional regulator [Clostridia bacterium]
MKIKTVCEMTGLTSRAIRVYIEEQLISPTFTENYLGRRSFDFSDDDVEALKHIAILRKNDFSIDEIRDIICDAEKSIAIVQKVRSRIEKQVEEYSLRLQAISRIDSGRAYTISELAYELSQMPNETQPPQEPYKPNLIKALKAIAVFIVVWLPIALCLFSLFISGIGYYAYPKVNAEPIVFTVLSVLPTFFIFILSKRKFRYKKLFQNILLVFCILSIPSSFLMPLGIVTRSETTDFRNYRDFDPGCLANRNIVFQELFPSWPNYFVTENFKKVYLDATYYYQYFEVMDYTYDIYAEWPLEEEEFAAEVQRVKEVFEKAVANKTYGYQFVEMEKGTFSCLILYSGNDPFHEVTDNYEYLIFAYDEENKVVRYVYCDSLENGVDQPYYLQLEW